MPGHPAGVEIVFPIIFGFQVIWLYRLSKQVSVVGGIKRSRRGRRSCRDRCIGSGKQRGRGIQRSGGYLGGRCGDQGTVRGGRSGRVGSGWLAWDCGGLAGRCGWLPGCCGDLRRSDSDIFDKIRYQSNLRAIGILQVSEYPVIVIQNGIPERIAACGPESAQMIRHIIRRPHVEIILAARTLAVGFHHDIILGVDLLLMNGIDHGKRFLPVGDIAVPSPLGIRQQQGIGDIHISVGGSAAVETGAILALNPGHQVRAGRAGVGFIPAIKAVIGLLGCRIVSGH